MNFEMRSFPLFLAGLILLATAKLIARFHPEVLREVDATMARAILEKKLPGGIVWIEREGQTWQKAYGQRAVRPRTEPTTPDTLYDMASLTKVLATAPAILILAEQGRLDLDRFVSETISLDDVEEAFNKMERGEVLRSVVLF